MILEFWKQKIIKMTKVKIDQQPKLTLAFHVQPEIDSWRISYVYLLTSKQILDRFKNWLQILTRENLHQA